MHKKSADSRPVNLDLFSLKLPITAISSILHRVSGFALFLAIPFVLYVWQISLQGQNDFLSLQKCLSSWQCKILVWLIISALIYHVVAGIRHLLMDMHIGDTKQGGRTGAYSVFVVSIILSLVLGVSIW